MPLPQKNGIFQMQNFTISFERLWATAAREHFLKLVRGNSVPHGEGKKAQSFAQTAL